MMRGTILKDFFKNTILTVGIAYLLFTWMVPFGHDITFTIGIFAVNIIIGGIFVLTWKLVVAAWYIPLTICRLVTVGKGGGTDIYNEE